MMTTTTTTTTTTTSRISRSRFEKRGNVQLPPYGYRGDSAPSYGDWDMPPLPGESERVPDSGVRIAQLPRRAKSRSRSKPFGLDAPSVLPGSGVHVWHIPLNGTSNAEDWSILSSDERTRAARFFDDRRAEEWVQARAWWRRVLGRHLCCDPATIRVSHDEYGASVVAPFVHQSMSHTKGLALIAVAECPVGVHVEQIRPIDFTSIATSFAQGEKAAIEAAAAAGAAQQLDTFYRLWTRKEAWLKAQRAGIQRSRDSFEVNLHNSPKFGGLLWTAPDYEEAGRWSLQGLNVGDGFAGALAYLGHRRTTHRWVASPSRSLDVVSTVTITPASA